MRLKFVTSEFGLPCLAAFWEREIDSELSGYVSGRRVKATRFPLIWTLKNNFGEMGSTLSRFSSEGTAPYMKLDTTLSIVTKEPCHEPCR